MSGIEISSAINLINPLEYDIEPAFAPGGNELIGLSYSNQSMLKHYEFTPLVRLYWSSIEEEVCLETIVDVVNEDYHNTLTFIEDGCVVSSGVASSLDANAPLLFPNPMTESATLRYANPTREQMTLIIADATGRIVYEERVLGTSHVIERGALKTGAYIYTLKGASVGNLTGRLNVE